MKGRTRQVEGTDGTRIAFEESGDGFPVVLLHGFTETRESWVQAGYVDALTRIGMRVVAIDQRGHGESGRPQDASLYSTRHRVGDALAVLDALDIGRAAFMGYSMGGVLALAATASAPNRVAATVAIGAHPFAEDLSHLRGAIAAGLDDWATRIEAALGGLHPAMRQRLLDNDPGALSACVAFDRIDFSQTLAASSRPVLALLGENDPRHAWIHALAAFDNVETMTLPGADHFESFLTARAALPELAAFLTRHIRATV